jgi:hypothetical protein
MPNRIGNDVPCRTAPSGHATPSRPVRDSPFRTAPSPTYLPGPCRQRRTFPGRAVSDTPRPPAPDDPIQSMPSGTSQAKPTHAVMTDHARPHRTVKTDLVGPTRQDIPAHAVMTDHPRPDQPVSDRPGRARLVRTCHV